MNPKGIPMAVILWSCAAVFLGIGCWAARRRDPMHFWAGSTVRPQEIRDIPAYNRACARLWWSYGAVYVLAGAASLFARVDFCLWADIQKIQAVRGSLCRRSISFLILTAH